MEKAFRIYKILLAAATTAVIMLLCAQVADIYQVGALNGGQMYTCEDVAARLIRLGLPLILYVVMVLAGIVWRTFVPDKCSKTGRSGYRAARDSRSSPTLRLVLYAAAVLLTVLGIFNGGLWDVLVKAVNICTECIGLG